MEWIKTTLRKGTKSPRICRDMFITDSRGKFEIVIVKNGSISTRNTIEKESAIEMISRFSLVGRRCIFANALRTETIQALSSLIDY